ncbi:MAG: ABC transporter permease [Elusimicrobiota bacterium]|jgi:spermidine/putrescine transport system permease protein|nr:ABC transporter permease [Elusimicrobiota bacterium]
MVSFFKNPNFRKKTVPLFAMISPVTAWLFLLIAVPLIYILIISFCSTNESHNIVFDFTLRNYARLFDSTILGIYTNSLIVAVLTTVVCVLIAYPFGYIMASTTPFRKALMMIFLMLPFWTNSLIRLYSWRVLLGRNGYVNDFLIYIGLIDAPIEMMFTRGAVILGMVYTLLPFMVLPIHTVIDKLDNSLIEASKDLGAGFWKTFRYITLPLTAPGIFAGSIMVFIPSLGFFFVSDLMGGGNNQIIGNVISRQFKEAYNWPFGAALSIMLIAITLICVKLYTKSGGKLDELGTV